MAKPRIRWNLKAFEEIRRLPSVEPILQTEVDGVLTAVSADGNYEGGVESGRSRLRGFVVTADFAAIYAESSDHALQRALEGRRKA